MFGHQDDQPHQDNSDSSQIHTPPTELVTAGAPSQPADTALPAWQHPGTPLSDSPSSDVTPTSSEPATQVSPTVPAPDDDEDAADTLPTAPPLPTATPDDQPTGDLLSIKHQALGQLSPLVSHLDQTPEEQFRTLMMMIQGSDDQSLVKSAYDTAQKITDEKARAQALLDIINEINYFTQPKHD